MNGPVQKQKNKFPPLAPPDGRGTHFSPLRGETERGATPLQAKAIIFTLILILVILIGCQDAEPTPQPASIAEITATPLALSTPQPITTDTPIPIDTATIIPTHTPSPTPTPTATAVPAKLSGNLRTIRLNPEPEAKNGAPCGLVDIFDFPIAPPDAIGVNRSGGDFGQFRQRYEKFHAGEDWGGSGGGSSFGEPVYSIGHGRVMYAQPEGWNRDKGVVIIEHAVDFPSGRQIIYAFYGHLDPPSIVLEPGVCVQRNDLIGNIGKPRTPPHLHFEIRTHMPYSPGPGYWEEDPTTAGWLPPSQIIWNQRIFSSPGVTWLRPFSPTRSEPIGPWQDNLFLTIEDGRLIATNLETGRSQPGSLFANEIDTGLLHEQSNTLFLVTEEEKLMAFADELFWQAELDGNGRSTLLPLPNGGLMVIRGDDAVGYGADGRVLWQDVVEKRPFAWTLTDDSLIYSLEDSEGSTWAAAADQPPAQIFSQSGHPFWLNNEIWLYANDGVYQNNELIFSLPTARLDLGDAQSLPDKGALIAHTDLRDRRLLKFNEAGILDWDLSIAHLPAGIPQLITTPDQVLLFIESSFGSDVQTHVYNIDLSDGSLAHIFNGGSRPYSHQDTWIMTAGASQVAINSAGGAILGFNPRQAIDTIKIASPPN